MLRVEKPYVLLADDNEATCTLITALLRHDFHVDVATDGREAIDRLRTRRYQAVLLDLRMPIVDGFAVLDFLKEHRPEALPNVLVVTAALSSGELERANAYGVCAIVTKPFDVETLRARVKECAATDDGIALGPVLCSSGPMILLLADLLRQRLL
jgi:CheY-like chemotaxis protein